MSISLEVVKHVEGIPDADHFAFLAAGHSKLTSAPDPINLLASMPTDMIFAPYSARRRDLMSQLLVRGFFDETLFPKIKDLVRYGADWLSSDGKGEDAVEKAVDAAVIALSTLIPSLAPAIQALGPLAKSKGNDAFDSALDSLRQWATNVEGYKPVLPIENVGNEGAENDNSAL